LLATALTSCTRDPVIAEIGRFKITESYARYRDGVERALNPHETRNLGLSYLGRVYPLAEIYLVNGQRLDQETLLKEEKRIDRETAAPEVLAQVKAVFGDHHQAYLDVYVLPVYVERELYFGYFLKSPIAQAKSISQAEELLREANVAPEKLESIAKAHGNPTAKFTVSLQNGLEWPPPPPSPGSKARPNPEEDRLRAALAAQAAGSEANSIGRQWIEQLIRPLKPGMLVSRVIDGGNSWQVVRYVRPAPDRKDAYEMQGAFVPKDRFDEWLKTEKTKIKVWVKEGYTLSPP
jgi:hypothetical protein